MAEEDSLLASEEEMFDEPIMGQIRGTSVNIRSGPATSNRLVVRLDGGTEVHVIARSGEWYFIGRDDTYGWVNRDKLRLPAA